MFKIMYKYYGTDNTTGKQVKGYIPAPNAKKAKELLSELGITASSVSFSLLKTLTSFREKELSSYELKDLMFAFYNAQKSGISMRMIVDSLPDMFSGEAKKKAERIRYYIKNEGLQLSLVFKKVGLPDFIVHSVEAAEVGGGLEEVLEKVVKVLDIMAKSEAELKKALLYPKIVLVLIVFVIFFIDWKIVPQLKDLYANIPDYLLPGGTKLLMSMSEKINKAPSVSIALAIGIAVFLWKTVTVNIFLAFVSSIHTLGEKLPSLKPLVKRFSEFIDSYETMKICYFLDLLHSAGIKPNKVVEHIRSIVSTRSNKKKLDIAKRHIESGLPIFKSFEYAGFDKQLVGFIRAGEEQNGLSFYMRALAEYKERSFAEAIEKVKTIIPMLLMILASSIIVSIMFYIIAPLYNITG